MNYAIERYGSSLWRMEDRGNFVGVSAMAGEAILLNQAIFGSREVKATPFTDFRIHHDILKFKMSRGNKDPHLKEILRDYGYTKNARIDLTAVNVINEVIPSLENVTVDDVLHFRDSHRDSLEGFRTEMGRLATEIETNYWDDDFYQKVRDRVDDEIKPKIKDLKNSTESFKDKLLRGANSAVQVAPLALVSTIFPAAPEWVGITAGASLGTLKNVLEYDKSERSKKKNGLIFLLEAESIKRSMSSRLRSFKERWGC